MKIKIKNPERPLYQRYEGQTDAQPAIVELDCREGTLTARVDGEIGGGVPVDVWNRRTLRLPIPPLTDRAARQLLEDIRPLAERVLAGYSEELNWQDNYVGVYSHDAEEAIQEIGRLCEEDNFLTPEEPGTGDILYIVEPDEWYGEIIRHDNGAVVVDSVVVEVEARLDMDSSDEDIARVARAMEDKAERDGVILDGNVEDWIRREIRYAADA